MVQWPWRLSAEDRRLIACQNAAAALEHKQLALGKQGKTPSPRSSSCAPKHLAWN